MYDRPETAAATDALWAGTRDRLRAAGIDAPDALDRRLTPEDGWARGDLLLGQICSLPWRARFRDKVRIVGAPDHWLADTEPGFYRSVVIVRRNGPATMAEAATAPLAYNDPLSQSGWGALWSWTQERGLRPCPVLCTGSHAASLRAVAEGRVEVAAIDAVTWRALARWEPAAASVRIAGVTDPTPGLSYCTGPDGDPKAVFAALDGAIAALAPMHRATLGLRGIVRLPAAAYNLPVPPDPRPDVA